MYIEKIVFIERMNFGREPLVKHSLKRIVDGIKVRVMATLFPFNPT